MRYTPTLRRIGPWLLVLGLTACGHSGPAGDLVAYVAQVKARQAKAPVAKETPKKRETFRYRADSDGIRDPFLGQLAPSANSSHSDSGVRPEHRQGRGPLEQYPLDSLTMVGTMSSGSRTVALVQSSDGVVHQVKIGDYMGQHYGKVVAITRKGIRLRELFPDGSGGWQKRLTTVALAK